MFFLLKTPSTRYLINSYSFIFIVYLLQSGLNVSSLLNLTVFNQVEFIPFYKLSLYIFVFIYLYV